jgi:predicted peroxiredoxin
MAKKLTFVGTYGSENPTKAFLPFLQAKGAVEAGIEAEIVLVGDAVVMMRDVVADSVFPVGWPPFKEIFAVVVEHKIPIYV